MPDVKITKKTTNPMMEREEVECIVNFEEGTPKAEEIKQLIAKTMIVSPDLLIVNKFIQNFGAKQAKVVACVYKTPEAKNRAVKEKKKAEKKPGSS